MPRPRPLPALAVPLLLALAACGEPSAAPPADTPPRQPPPVAAAAIPPPPAPEPGLTPLPSPQQVVTSQPVGTRDPFQLLPSERRAAAQAAADAAAAGRPGGSGPAQTAPAGPPPLPAGFRMTGIVSAGGRTEAVVNYREQSGSLRQGDRGGVNTPLLPPGWSVARIDLAQGRLILRFGRYQVKAEI